MRLRAKMALLVTLMIGAIAGFINFYVPARMQARMLAHLETEARNTARMVSFSVAPALVFGDRASGAEALRGVEVLTDLSYVVVEDASGARFAAVHPERMSGSSSATASRAERNCCSGSRARRVLCTDEMTRLSTCLLI